MATIFTVDAHAAGEPCRVITAGVPALAGVSVAERRDDFRARYDWVRTGLMQEPRGHSGMFGALLLAPARPSSAFSLIFFDPVGYLDGCGHATLCSIAVWQRLMGHPDVPFDIDNPDGSITRVLSLENGRDRVTAVLEMPPARVLASELLIPGLDADGVALAQCGNHYLTVDADALGIEDLRALDPAELRRICTEVREAATSRVKGVGGVPAPPVADWLSVALHQRIPESRGGDPAAVPTVSTAILFSGAQLDRSPCGTGSSAVYAVFADRGEPGERLRFVGPVGGTFELARTDGTAASGAASRYRFRLTGTADIIGVHEWILGEDDPARAGFRFE